jgi:hypothetical protein
MHYPALTKSRGVPTRREFIVSLSGAMLACAGGNAAFGDHTPEQRPITVNLAPIPWPDNLAPQPAALGNYEAGKKITGPLNAKADVLIVLYTDIETSALLDVFTQNTDWSPVRRQNWCSYGHNFEKFQPIITAGLDDYALQHGTFGYLSALTVGTKTIVLYKTELHPKANGALLPFVPVMQQLIDELRPGLVISTGTAGAIGGNVICGDVAITSAARFKCNMLYPNDSDLNIMNSNKTLLTNDVAINPKYLNYAADNLTKLTLDGLAQCYIKLQTLVGYSFVKRSTDAPAIYVTDQKPVAGPQPMVIVSSDYYTVDDNNNSEELQSLGIMNDSDDTFLFYAISKLSAVKPKWLSVRNVSDPQVVIKPFPPGTSSDVINTELADIASKIYDIYQYCTTLNSAFACWGVVAGM